MDRNSTEPVRSSTSSHGVVGVIVRDEQYLLIRRSLTVVAPGLVCFAGGHVESGESETVALVREMQEELSINVQPSHRLWQSVTRWGTKLGWWLIELDADMTPSPNPAEVAEVLWLSRDEIRMRNDLLGSMPEFLAAWDDAEFIL